MANHGYCKNCWWYKKNDESNGCCWMHDGDGVPFKKVKQNSYCPDYVNREKYNKRNKKTLEELIEEWNKD